MRALWALLCATPSAKLPADIERYLGGQEVLGDLPAEARAKAPPAASSEGFQDMEEFWQKQAGRPDAPPQQAQVNPQAAGDKPTLSYLFATPMLQFSLSGPEGPDNGLHANIAAEVRRMLSALLAEYGATGLSPKQQAAEFLEWQHSSWDQRGTLWPEIETLPAYDRFRRRILDVTRAYVMVSNDKSVRGAVEDMAKRQARLHTWVSVLDGYDEIRFPANFGGYVCGLYILETETGSSVTVRDPRQGPAFASSVWTFTPTLGEVVLFPSYLEHVLQAQQKLMALEFCIEAVTLDEYLQKGDPLGGIVLQEHLDMSLS